MRRQVVLPVTSIATLVGKNRFEGQATAWWRDVVGQMYPDLARQVREAIASRAEGVLAVEERERKRTCAALQEASLALSRQVEAGAVSMQEVESWLGSTVDAVAEERVAVARRRLASWSEVAPVASGVVHEPPELTLEVEQKPVASTLVVEPVASTLGVEPVASTLVVEPVASTLGVEPVASTLEVTSMVVRESSESTLGVEQKPVTALPMVEPEFISSTLVVSHEPDASALEVTSMVVRESFESTLGVAPEPVASMLEGAPEPVASMLGVAPEPVASMLEGAPEPVASMLGVAPEPVASMLKGAPEPVASMLGVSHEPAESTLGVEPEPAESTFGVSLEPAESTLEVTYEPVASTLVVSHEPVASTLGVAPEPVASTLVVSHEPVASMLEGAPEPVASMLGVSHEPAESTLGVEPEPAESTFGVSLEPAESTLEVTHEPVASMLEVEPVASTLEVAPVASMLEVEPVASTLEGAPEPVASTLEGAPEPAESTLVVSHEPAESTLGVSPEPVASTMEVAPEPEPESEPVAPATTLKVPPPAIAAILASTAQALLAAQPDDTPHTHEMAIRNLRAAEAAHAVAHTSTVSMLTTGRGIVAEASIYDAYQRILGVPLAPADQTCWYAHAPLHLPEGVSVRIAGKCDGYIPRCPLHHAPCITEFKTRMQARSLCLRGPWENEQVQVQLYAWRTRASHVHFVQRAPSSPSSPHTCPLRNRGAWLTPRLAVHYICIDPEWLSREVWQPLQRCILMAQAARARWTLDQWVEFEEANDAVKHNLFAHLSQSIHI